jgi:hypothetical protein
MRIEVPKATPNIDLDDWQNAVDLLPGPAAEVVQVEGDRVAEMFLRELASPYVPAVSE